MELLIRALKSGDWPSFCERSEDGQEELPLTGNKSRRERQSSNVHGDQGHNKIAR